MKLCGLSREEDVDAAVEAGADALGFIVGFPKSPRNQTLENAAELRERVPPFVSSVLVTTIGVVRMQSTRIARMAPESIQLYGYQRDPIKLRRRLGIPLIRPIHMEPSQVENVMSLAEGYDAIIIDTHDPALAGGTGRTSDWGSCRVVRERVAPLPMVLSGGLTPDNVGEAIRAVRPYAVDVSSGVESSPGRKDRAKMSEFVRNAKGAA